MSVNVKWIERFDGDWGAHCNACEYLAVYVVSLNSLSFRLCESCSSELLKKFDDVLVMKSRRRSRGLTKDAPDLKRASRKSKVLSTPAVSSG